MNANIAEQNKIIINDKHYNLMEFEQSKLDKNIQPLSKYKYDIKHQIYWWWNDLHNLKPIIMTVALPAFNSKKIIWLALESLKNQTNINFAWELICFEEHAESREIIKSYTGLLPGCARIIHRNIDPNEGHYRIGKYTLLEKWIEIAKCADINSKIYVKHACDCYSPPKRLFIHFENFKNSSCHYSTQPRGYFYNILLDKYCLYDGYRNKFQRRRKNMIKPHLNMALRTEYMKKIKLPSIPIFSSIDSYIYGELIKILNINSNKKKIIFCDDEIDKNSWKGGIDTDGYNNISLTRRNMYLKKIHSVFIPVNIAEGLDLPPYVIERLKQMKNK